MGIGVVGSGVSWQDGKDGGRWRGESQWIRNMFSKNGGGFRRSEVIERTEKGPMTSLSGKNNNNNTTTFFFKIIFIDVSFARV